MDKLYDRDLRFIIFIFLLWRITLFLPFFVSSYLFPLQGTFLGGGVENYLANPSLYAWLNFDGQHYLSIAYQGYLPLTHFYFPVYPLLSRLIASPFGRGISDLSISGLFVSNVSFLFALFGLKKLLEIDFEKEKVFKTIFSILLFPTSFYFASYYTESLFLALVVWSFYFLRKRNWIMAGVLAGLSSATRIVGLALIPAMLVEMWMKKGKRRVSARKLLGLLLAPAGLIVYMAYLKVTVGDPLEFFHSVEIFGQQRTAGFVLLPQVFYRYVFKILPSIDYSYFPAVFTTWLEFLSAVVFSGLGLVAVLAKLGWIKVKDIDLPWSYLVYYWTAFLIPTFSGSFSSLPRYVLVIFPAFMIAAELFGKLTKYQRLVLYLAMFACLFVATALFVRGYWVA